MQVKIAQYANAHPALQKLGEKKLFHLNFANNLIPVTSSQQPGSHPQYDSRIILRLNDLWDTYNNAGGTSTALTQLLNGVTQLIITIRNIILANPGTQLNNLNF